ncbi:hypothetical protein BDV96DRAFT_583316 [Lophiotrema nucula]|uniref:Subtilisin-like serine protease n=1 Tax=Lophiotrema nucula TaxID=690887 RepID=A0A6A5YV88_9PLEO|nr:hypothetical protein BDV96DRAFT_583316 [Lophiotrema nucula]
MDIPFEEANELVKGFNTGCDNVPGHPRIRASHTDRVLEFLEDELCSADLEQIGPKLWWFSMHDRANISPLHRQHVKNRTIIVTEESRLHLVWYYDRIFIKPLPKYLLSHAFWKTFLSTNRNEKLNERKDRIRRAALGFLRTYYFLIKHESDFIIARENNIPLIPSGTTWDQFCAISSQFDRITDDDTNIRYQYGEIRLSRLNFYAPLLLGRSTYHRVVGQYRDYFKWFYAPVVFFFALTSLMLSAMQVGISVEEVMASRRGWLLWEVSRWFSVLSMLGTTLVVGVLAMVFMLKYAREWVYAFQSRRRKKRGRSVC